MSLPALLLGALPSPDLRNLVEKFLFSSYVAFLYPYCKGKYHWFYLFCVQHFKTCGPIHEVSVAMKKDPKNPQQLISLGYGFIQFKKRADSEKALKTLQHSVLNEHAIELKCSNRTVKYVYP